MGRLIDIENIDYVRLEDSLHCLEHHKGDEVECVICAPTVEAIPKADYENRLKADMVAMLTDIQLEIEETPNPISTRITGCSKDGWFLGMAQAKGIIQHKINALRGGEDGNDD